MLIRLVLLGACAALLLNDLGAAEIRPDDPVGARRAIQAAIDSLPEAGGVVTVSAGRYVLDGMIHVNRSHVTLQGQSGTILALRDGARSPVLLVGSDVEKPTSADQIYDVTIRSIEIDGNRAAQDNELNGAKNWLRNNCIDVRAVSDLTIEDVNAHHARSGGIVVSWHSDRVTIREFQSHDNYFDGVAIYDCRHALVTGFRCFANDGAGVSLDNKVVDAIFSSGFVYENRNVGIFLRHCDGVHFRDLSVRQNRSFGAFLAHATYPPEHPQAEQIIQNTGFHNCTIVGCSFTDNRGHAVCVESTADLSSKNCVTGCVCSGHLAPSIRTLDSRVLVASNNVVHDEKAKLEDGN